LIIKKVRREVTRHFRNKKKKCLKAKIEELNNESKSIRDMCRSISNFRRVTVIVLIQ
jgi:hypothetical protein